MILGKISETGWAARVSAASAGRIAVRRRICDSIASLAASSWLLKCSERAEYFVTEMRGKIRLLTFRIDKKDSVLLLCKHKCFFNLILQKGGVAEGHRIDADRIRI
jgi:hypothetical protein